jgi:hypothetical protein
VIFIGAVVDGAVAEGLVPTGAGFPPQAAVTTISDHPAPIADRRNAMFTRVILNDSPEPRLNISASVDATGPQLALQ